MAASVTAPITTTEKMPSGYSRRTLRTRRRLLPGRRANVPSFRARVAGATTGGTRANVGRGSAVFNTRVEEGIGEVDDEIDQDYDQTDEQNVRLDLRIVAN